MTVILRKDTSLVDSSNSIKKKYLEYIDSYSESDILRILTYLSKAQSDLKLSQDQKLLTEVALSHIIGFEKSSTISELLDKIKSGNFGSAGIKKKADVKTTPKKDLHILAEDQSSNNYTSDHSADKDLSKNNIPKRDDSFKSPKEVISNVSEDLSPDESSLINAIINELGGKELRS